jgi:hypothetical protein
MMKILAKNNGVYESNDSFFVDFDVKYNILKLD